MMTMGTIHRWARRLWVDQRGQDMIEYALVSALVVVLGSERAGAVGGADAQPDFFQSRVRVE